MTKTFKYKDIQIIYKCQYYWALGKMYTSISKAKQAIDETY